MSLADFQIEIERIKEEYARRKKEIAPDFYSVKKPANRFMLSSRRNSVLKLLKTVEKIPLTGLKILDFGCGKGDWLADFCGWGAEETNLHGIEILHERLAEAVKRFPSADLKLGSGSDLPWPDGSFDIVLQSTVFSSILEPKLKKRLAEEMFRVLKPGGFILWYDFAVNNPWNSHVQGVSRTEIQSLFPVAKFNFRKITLAPPITRILANFSLALCSFLQGFGFLNTHLLAAIKKGSAVSFPHALDGNLDPRQNHSGMTGEAERL